MVGILGVAMLCLGNGGCKREPSSTEAGGAPSGRAGQMQTVNKDNLTSPVDQASGAAATKRPLPATQPSAGASTQPSTKP
jgi:hypothetical protein